MLHRGDKIVLKFLVPYLLILIVPIIIGLLTYNKTIEVIENETAKSNMTLLNQSKEIIDRRLDEVDSITQQIMLDPTLISYQYIANPFDGTNTFRTIEMKKSLINYKVLNNFISNFYVFFTSSKLVLTPASVYDFPTFYQNVLQRENYDADQWYERITKNYHSKTIETASAYSIDGRKQKMVTYVQSLGFALNSYATIVVLIDEQEFAKMFKGLDISDGGSAYIMDRNGQIISSVSDPSRPFKPVELDLSAPSGTIFPSARSGDKMITYTTSANNGLTYVVSQPAHIALEKVTYIKNTMFFIFIISLLAGLIIALYMAYRSSKPIRFLVNTIEPNGEEIGRLGKSKDVYQLIQAGIFRLKTNNDVLQQEMDKQRPMLRTAFFERLLKGEFPLSDDIKLVMKRLDIRMEGQSFAVAILSLSDPNLILQKDVLQEPDYKSLWIQDAIARIDEPIWFHELNSGKIALIFSCDSAHPDDCKARVTDFVDQLNKEMQEWPYGPSIAVGNSYASLEEISRSYQEAEQALDYKVWKVLQGIVWFSDLPQNSGSYYFPSDLELKLMNFIKAGNQAEMRKLFAELLSENLEKRNLSSSMMKLLLYDLKGSIAKLEEQIVIEDKALTKQVQALLAPADHPEDAQETFRMIERTCASMCEVVNGRKRSHNDQLIAGIMEMIHAQYSSPNFSLLTISEKFHITEIYLSYFIKEQTGITFSEYLEKLRMEQAKDLLADDRHTVKDVAEKVGYNSSNTFCRAFKRMNGISTTEYKRSLSLNG